MLKAAVCFLIVLNSLSCFSQSFWAYIAGSTKQDEATDICSDPGGNIITTGYFSGQTVFSYANNISLIPAAAGNADIFISKCDAAGQLLWVKKAGGLGSDKALSVISDASGNIYITGFYSGSASFGTYTLSSVSGSQDGFIAKLDASGNFLWAVSFGGPLADQGNSIAVDSQGYPVVTGAFRGTALFGSASLTSLINPVTNLVSADIFIAKYAPSGLFDWVRQGKAKFEDSGLDIITDPANNVYVCGQFSDTITFQNTYNNPIMNASYVVKYNSTGQEQWFRKMAGVFSTAYSMAMDNSNKLYVTGDFQGTLTYFGASGNSSVSGLYNLKAFLLKIDQNGSFIWGKTESSTGYVSGKRVALDPQQDPYIFGEFGCTMKEYSDAYGPGVFNSIGFRDLFITKYSQGGTRQWFRHFGGPMQDNALGLLVPAVNEPVMGGSYENNINFPVTAYSLTATNMNISASIGVPNQPISYCSSPGNYEDYYSFGSQGFADIYVFRGMDLSRTPYDYYDRAGTNCDLSFVGSCISCASCSSTSTVTVPFCPDTIRTCGDSVLIAAYTRDTPASLGVGPLHQFSWNNNPNEVWGSIWVKTNGINTVSVTTLDGCYSSVDNVYVILDPIPPAPVISDSYGINTLHPAFANPIYVCTPQTFTLTGGNVQNTTYHWTGPYTSTHDSIAVTSNPGIYRFSVTSQFGCYNYNEIGITFDSPPVPFVPKQKNDTIRICPGASGVHIIYDSITNPSGSLPSPPCVSMSAAPFLVSASPGLSFSQFIHSCDPSIVLTASVTGNYTYTIGYPQNSLCTHDTIFFTGHIHVHVKTAPSGTFSIQGGGMICPGDSTLISASNLSILSPHTTYTMNPTSVWAYSTGMFGFGLYMTDTVSGCTDLTVKSVTVEVKPNPFIISYPNRVICPNDSLFMAVNLFGAPIYEWHGPGGILPQTSQIIYAHQPGFYYCVVTDSGGCVFTTSPVELKQYSTPYLTSAPGTIMCFNQPVTLHAVAIDTTHIVWGSPLSGNSATQVVTMPGVYSCTVTMCGISTTSSITIIGSNPTASITAFPSTTVCPHDSVILSASPPGMTLYYWQPSGNYGTSYTAHDGGDYVLQVTDSHGCQASASVSIVFTSTLSPPTSPIHDTVCAGQTASLSVTPSGYPVDWFSNAFSGPVIYTGNPYVTGPVSTQLTYYAASVNTAGCHSTAVPVTAYLYNTSIAPVLLADTSVCSGDTLQIIAPLVNGATYAWAGPGVSTVTSNSVVIPQAGTGSTGTYSVYLSGFGCTSVTSSVNITVVNTLAPMLSGGDSICAGSSYYAAVDPVSPGNSYTWLGPNGFSANNDSLIFVPALPSQSGTYTVSSSQLGCISAANLLHLTVLDIPPGPVISSNSPVCAGDDIYLSYSPASPYTVKWLGPNGFQSAQNPLTFPATPAHAGSYSLSMKNAFCQGPSATQLVQVLEQPVLSLGNDTIACNDEALVLTCSSSFPAYLWNNGATTANIHVSESGTYKVTSANGKCIASDSIKVDIIPCNFTIPTIFSPNGDGVNELFRFNSPAIKEVFCEIWDRWGLKIAEFRGTQNGWNGWNMYTNKPCSDGTYFYIAGITTISGEQKTLRGFITLVR